MTPLDRIASRIVRSADHHLWTGKVDRYGQPVTKHRGRSTTVRRLVWEIANGPLEPGEVVVGCPVKACVRLDHLRLRDAEPVPIEPTRARPQKAHTARPKSRATRGAGSKTLVRPGVWKLTVSAGRYADGRPRRLHKTVRAPSAAAASRELAAFVTEVSSTRLPRAQGERDISVDDALEQFLVEHLLGEKGREPRTVDDYRRLHTKWFAPEIGKRRVRDVDSATMDRGFGKMRAAGLSRSRMNHARSLYAPFFRWAKRHGLTNANPMTEFELPTSRYVSRERTPPEVEQLSLLLGAAVEVIDEVGPLLVLGAVTGMRRGELTALRRSRLDPAQNRITVDSASDGTRVKPTKTRIERSIFVDAATMAMLLRHCEQMDERAALFDVTVPADGFVFSLAPDCSVPMPPDHVTKRVAVLKEHLGIEDKRPETIALEDAALRLYRQPPAEREPNKTGPMPNGGMSLESIGAALGRSSRWAALAVASAWRREAAAATRVAEPFDGSILALRKFTSTELLDAGFNISMVARRQGHGPQVLAKHYSKLRKSADRKAAEHLGKVVHRTS